MSDITKRLRSSDVFNAPVTVNDTMVSPVALMAADEIDRLRGSVIAARREGIEAAMATAHDAGGGVVVKRWIIVHEPGRIPEKKNPCPQTDDGVTDFLIALALCRPPGTCYTVAELTWDHDLLVQSGREALAECRLAGPRRFAKRVRGIAEKEAAWLKADPKRVEAVARGRLVKETKR